MKREKFLALFLLLLLVIAGLFYAWGPGVSILTAAKKGEVVVTLGQDLSEEEKQKILSQFGIDKKKQVRLLSISNLEEQQTLAGLVDQELIGSRAISSAYVEQLDKARGIEVQTRNITAITPFMYANALTTAGVRDARVIVAAPFPVSGTAALAGIIKGFELAKGESLNQEAKAAAGQELAKTAKLGQKIGQDRAQKLIYEIKREVLEKKVSDPQEIDKIVINVSTRMNIDISEDDRKILNELMIKLAQLNMNSQTLLEQLQGLDRNLKEVDGIGSQVGSFLTQLRSLMGQWVQVLRNMLP